MSLIGKKAPSFTTSAVVGGNKIVNNFSLADIVGKKEILLFFYPKDFTFVCPTELISFQKSLNEFHNRGVLVIGCSTDTEETHLAWLNTPINQGGISGVTYTLLSDATKSISANYGVLGGTWEYDENDNLVFQGIPVAYRGTFFIDIEGIIRHQTINDLPLGRNVNEMLRVIDMWHHVKKYGEVCPANWQMGEKAIQANTESVSEYLTKYIEYGGYNQDDTGSCSGGGCGSSSCGNTNIDSDKLISDSLTGSSDGNFDNQGCCKV